MNTKIIITVVIPTYNRGVLLQRSVQSVLKQNYDAFEILVVDDGSTDGSVVDLKKKYHDNRLRVVEMSNNQGVHAARNKGIEESAGDYIVFLDSDDEMFVHALNTFVEIIKNKNADWISAPYEISTGGLSGIDQNESGWISVEDIFCERNIRGNKAGLGCIKRSRIGDIRFAAPNLDFIFYRKLTRAARMYYYAEPLGIYYREPNATSLHVCRRKLNAHLSMDRAVELDKYLIEFGSDLLVFCPNKFSDAAYGASVGLLLLGKRYKAFKRAIQSLRHGRFTIKRLFILLFSIIPFGPFILRKIFQRVARD